MSEVYNGIPVRIQHPRIEEEVDSFTRAGFFERNNLAQTIEREEPIQRAASYIIRQNGSVWTTGGEVTRDGLRTWAIDRGFDLHFEDVLRNSFLVGRR